jgi:CHASE2 domain-containing sensor protein
LRIPEVPFTPTLLASARSSGNTIVDSEPPASGAEAVVGLSDFTADDDSVCPVRV